MLGWELVKDEKLSDEFRDFIWCTEVTEQYVVFKAPMCWIRFFLNLAIPSESIKKKNHLGRQKCRLTQ